MRAGVSKNTELLFNSTGLLGDVLPCSRAKNTRKITKQLCQWIISASVSFYIAETKDIICFMKLFDPTYNVPTRATISRRLCLISAETSMLMKQYMHESNAAFSVTPGSWSLRIYEGNIFIKAHWISSD